MSYPIQPMAYSLEHCPCCDAYYRQHPSTPGRHVCKTGSAFPEPNDDPVLGRCGHGFDLDREFCPHGCRV